MRLIAALSSQWVATLLAALLSMGVTILLGRMLGPERFGAYQALLVLAAGVGILQEGGYATLLFREGTARTLTHEHALGGQALGHLAWITLLAMGCAALWNQEEALIPALFCMGLMAWHRFVSGFLRGAGAFTREAMWQVASRALTSVGILGAAWWAVQDLSWIFLGWAAGAGVALLLPMARASWCLPRLRVDPLVIRATAALVAIDLFTAIYFRSDILLMQHLKVEAAAIGGYAAVYRLLDGVILLAAPVGAICFRTLRLRFVHQRHFRKTLALFVLAGFLAAAVVVGVGYLWRGEILRLIYGEAYLHAVDLLPWLLLMLFFALPNTLLTQAALASNREWGYAGVAAGCALVNVGLNYWWIPVHGVMGSAWATIVTELLLCLGLMLLLGRGQGRSEAQ